MQEPGGLNRASDTVSSLPVANFRLPNLSVVTSEQAASKPSQAAQVQRTVPLTH